MKWVGGKSQLLPTLRPILARRLATVVNYAEPFLGGGSVLITVLSLGVKGRVVANAQLINFYRQARASPEALITRLRAVAEQYNQQVTTADRTQAVRFYLLNQLGFRGLYRVGPRGFNVPFGHYRRLMVLDLTSLSVLLRPVVFYNLDYRRFHEVIKSLPGPTLVYYDPPYVPITATSFTGYTTRTNGAPPLRPPQRG